MQRFDITSATPEQKEIYTRLSPGRRYLVDAGLASIDEYVDVIPVTQQPEAATNVVAPASRVSEDPAPEGILGAMGLSAWATGQTTAGEATSYMADQDNIPAATQARMGMLGVPKPTEESLIEREALGKELRVAGREDKARVQEYKDKEGIGEGWDGGARGIALSIAENPDMALTAIVGPIAPLVATLPAGRVYLSEYYAALDNGATKEQAKARAAAMASLEYGAESIPGLKALKAAGGAVTTSLRKIGTTAVEEAIQEGATELAQGGLDTALSSAEVGSEGLQKTTEAGDFDSIVDVASRTSYAATVGSVAAGTLRAGTAHLQTQDEINRVTAQQAHQQATLEYERQLKENVGKAQDTLLAREEQQKNDELAKGFAELQAANPTATPEEIAGLWQKKEAEDLAASGNTMADALVRGGVPGAVTGKDTREEDAALEQADNEETAKKLEEVITAEQAIEIAKAERIKEEEKATKGATKVWKNQKLAETKRLSEEVLDNPELDATHVSTGLTAWEQANPQPTKESVAKTLAEQRAANRQKAVETKAKEEKKTAKASPKPAVATAAKAADASDVSPEAVTARMRAEAERVKSGLKSEDVTQTPEQVEATGDLRDPEVFKARVKSLENTFRKQNRKMSVRNINAVNDSLRSGRVIVAKNGTKLATGEKLDGGAIFDGEAIYISQESLDDDSTERDLFSTVAHEVDHWFKHGKPTAKATKELFAGRDGMASMISRIEKLAESNHPVAKKAKAQAEEASEGDVDLYNEELGAYFIEYAAQASQKGMLGSARSAFNDAVAELKDSVLGRAFGMSLDEVKDSNTIARKRMSNLIEVTQDGGLDVGLQSIGGKRAFRFKNATFFYNGSVDGKARFEFSDEGAEINTYGDNWEAFEDGKPVALGKLLYHPELYENYPELRSMEVVIDPAMKGTKTYGSFQETVGVKLNPSIVDMGSVLLSTLLHEVQHSIQAIEGFVNGASPDSLVSNSVKNKVTTATDRIEQTVKSFELGAALRTLPPEVKATWDRMVSQRRSRGGDMTMGAIARWFLDQDIYVNSTDRLIRLQGKAFREAVSMYEDAKNNLKQEENRAFELYKRDYGEMEARNTEYRRRMTQAQRDANPPETTMKLAEYNIPVEEAINAGKLRPGQSPTPKASFRQKGEGEFKPLTKKDMIASFIHFNPDWESEGDDAPSANGIALAEWAKKAVPAYLNKYAGTPEDPLKDLKPFPDDEEATWDQVMDRTSYVVDKDGYVSYPSSFNGRVTSERNTTRARFNDKAEARFQYLDPKKELGIPDSVDKNLIETDSWILREFFNHVSDYLLLNVPSAKLQQYDFVRAVKETVAWDEANAKKAEKERQKKMTAANEGLPVHTEYEDGSKWVQLTKPGSLAHESDIMGHSVRGYEPTRYVDSNGKPIKNMEFFKPDGSPRGDTIPLYLTKGLGNISVEQALEAGAIKDNPDWTPASTTLPSSHPNYGHGGWDAIKSGTAKVYSLRDKNGLSHVTIEIEQPPNYDAPVLESGDIFTKNTPTKSMPSLPIISQIKGKGNDKPVAKYMPYVHDFILSLPAETEIDEAPNYWDAGNTVRNWFTDGRPTTRSSKLELPAKKSKGLQSKDTRRPKSAPVHFKIQQNYEAIKNILGLTGSVLSTKGGLGSVQQEILDNGQSLPTGWQYEAKVRHNRLNKEINKVLKTNPKFDWQAIQEKVEAEESAEIRERILNAAGREAPEVVREYRGFRDAMDELSTEIVLQRLAYVDKVPLSESEAAIYDAIMRNRGRYITRNYLATFGKRGEEFAARTLHGFERVEKLKAQGLSEKLATESELSSYTRFANAIDFLKRRITIPAELPEKVSELRELYSMWATPTGSETKEFLEEKLTATRERVEAHQEKLDLQARLIAKEILGLTDSAATSYASVMRGLSRDTTIITSRESVPEAIKELLGEVKDPAVKMMLTLAAQANLIARTKMLFELMDTPGAAISSDERTDPKNKDYDQPMVGSAFGPMEGMWVKKELATRLHNTLVPMLSYDQALLLLATHPEMGATNLLTKGVKAWVWAATAQKTLQVVWNVFNGVANYAGAFANLTRQGHFSYIVDAHKVALELIRSRNSTNLSPMAKEVLSVGVTDSAQVGELQSEQFAVIENLIYGETLDTVFDKGIRQFKNFKATGAEVYAMTDVWGKIANYMYQRDQLREFHKLNGDNKTEEQIRRLAADKVSDDNVTYKRAMPFAKALERLGLTWFATFTAEVFRSQYHNVVQGLKEVQQARNAKTPEAKAHMYKMAGRRGLGTAVTYSGLLLALEAIAGADDDEEDKAWKSLLPDWVRHGAPIYVGTDKEGLPMYITLSRLDPWGPMLDVIRAVGHAQEGRATEALWEQIKSSYIQPRLTAQTIKLLDKAIDPKSTGEDVRKVTGEILVTAIPSGVRNAAAPDSWIPGGRTNYPDEGKTQLGDFVKLLGGALVQGDPQKAGWPKAKAWEDAQARGRKELFQLLDDEDVNPAEFAQLLNDRRKVEQEMYRELLDFDRGLVLIKATPRQRIQMLEDIGLENKSLINAVMTGRSMENSTMLLSGASFKMQLDNEARKLPFSEQAAYKERVAANARKIQQELGFEFTK